MLSFEWPALTFGRFSSPMTPDNNLDLKGNFRSHPVAELLVEILHAKLSGSLRVSNAKRKAIIYFREGDVVYAVSNAREQRLFSVLLSRNKINQKTLSQFSDLANDIELAAGLEEKNIFTKDEICEFVTIQIESIIVDALTWPEGEWLFSPLTRLREDLVYKTDVYKVLINYARCLPSQDVYNRFRSVQERFYREANPRTMAVLQPHEKYALDCFGSSQLTIEELRPLCTLPEAAMLQSLYVLWLGGLLVRRDWNAAFSATKVGEILTAKVSLVKEAAPKIVKEAVAPSPREPEQPAAMKLPELHLSLEEYLDRVENAETLYDILGVADSAPLSDIKNSYFAMAKLFHPDRYHREETTKLRRIQVAFTKFAQAYETLKTDESRESYDFKMRKQLAYREKLRADGEENTASPEARQTEHGLESFEKGLEALSDEEYAAAAGHLSRAVHYSPQNALYHAYFGQALSRLEKQHHKAETSLQTAVKLDPKNPKIRMMLVEFFVDMKMTKRAEGELKRFLELVPGDKEAMKMAAKIQADA